MGDRVPQEVYDQIHEEYPAPLCYLLTELALANEARWLQHESRSDKIGADDVREHGLTKNQRRWADKLRDSVKNSNTGESNGAN